jgi:hypothetical protein
MAITAGRESADQIDLLLREGPYLRAVNADAANHPPLLQQWHYEQTPCSTQFR